MATIAIISQVTQPRQPVYVVRESAELRTATYNHWRRLARSVIIQACRDAAGIYSPALQEEARAWLSGPNGALFADAAGVDPDLLREWVNRGCPYKTKTGKTRKQKNGGF